MGFVDKNDAVAASQISRGELAQLYAAHWKPMARAATWLVGNRQSGEEIAQDAFVRLIEHWSTIRDPAAAPAWLRRTVVNLSRSTNRRNAIGREKRALAQARVPASATNGAEIGDRLVDGPLGAAIGSLPRRQRECIVLRFVHDLTVDQIAAALGVGSGSVKTHLHRAILALKEHEGRPSND